MSRILQGLSASSLALFITASGLAPASAAPFPLNPAPTSGVVSLAAYHGPVWRHHGWRGRGGGWDRRGDGGWGIGAGLLGGALIGGMLANNYGYYNQPYGYYGPPVVRRVPVYSAANAHVAWCYNRYRSYRAYDNSFQPNYGPRQQCVAPMDY